MSSSYKKWNITDAPNSDIILLVPHDQGPMDKPFYNLARYTSNAVLVWTAELPESGTDSYVDAELKDGKLSANSWSCWFVEININTGKIIKSKFTK